MSDCRVCEGSVERFLDLGLHPLSDAFREPGRTDEEYVYPLEVGRCGSCAMTQLLHEVPRERMFHADYPYRSSGSVRMVAHFTAVAERFLREELSGEDPFVVEIGSNDGAMLRRIAAAGVRHLGVDPSSGVGSTARAHGVRVRDTFFEEATAKELARTEGPASVVYAANTLCHIPYLDSVLAGVDALLTDDGIFVFEDPYVGDVLRLRSFDQIYDEHFYLFSATSVTALAQRAGLELVDVERLGVHGGEVRYTLARRGARPVRPSVADLLAEEIERGMDGPAPYQRFAREVAGIRDDLRTLLLELRTAGNSVVGYGATAKSATVNTYCGIGPDLVPTIHDTTPEKQGRLTPGMGIPVTSMAGFGDPYPDYAVLYAWNHADEIMAKETAFRAAGGRWIRYVPDVVVD